MYDWNGEGIGRDMRRGWWSDLNCQSSQIEWTGLGLGGSSIMKMRSIADGWLDSSNGICVYFSTLGVESVKPSEFIISVSRLPLAE